MNKNNSIINENSFLQKDFTSTVIFSGQWYSVGDLTMSRSVLYEKLDIATAFSSVPSRPCR